MWIQQAGTETNAPTHSIRFRAVQYAMKKHDLTCNHEIRSFPEHVKLYPVARLEGTSGESRGAQARGHSRSQRPFPVQMRFLSREKPLDDRPQRAENPPTISRSPRLGSRPSQNTDNHAGCFPPSRTGPLPKLCRDPQPQGAFSPVSSYCAILCIQQA
jgi:hypothetical protein